MLLTAREVAELTGRERRPAQCRALDGRTVTEAVAATGVLPPSVSRLVGRLTRAHALLADAYSPPAPRSRRPVV